MSGHRISRYRVVRRLGAGGMGEVFLAKDTELDRSVALKLMSAELATDPIQQKRFRAEAKAASGLNHPNICVIHEVGETEDGRPFLAMEYVEGQTLNVVMQQRRLRIREILTIGIQVADALDAAHARGILHRDIKPSNIMLHQRGQAKVLDFGLAKRFARDALSAITTPLTDPGSLLGTPHYMSPEQLLGRDLDQRSDLFSVGVILYELVVGQRPFLGKTVGETMNAVINQPPEPLGLENPIFSPALEAIIFKCLEKDPQKRYSTAKALGADLTSLRSDFERARAQTESRAATLTAALSSSPVQEPDKGVNQPRSRFRAIGILIAAAATIVGLLGWALLTPGKHDQQAASPPKGLSLQNLAMEKSVAVLPFDNYSAEKETDYLSDGLTEEITTTLARVPGLRVAARNSAFAFKSRKEDLRNASSLLGVATILEGSLRKAGNRIRVSAQLINVTNGLHVWAETYDRSVDDILAVEEDIAGKISARFALRAENEPSSNLPRRSPPNPDAHALYLKGLYFWNKRTGNDLEKAAQLFNHAIEKDPGSGTAYAGLALTYICLPDYVSRLRKDFFPLARAAAEKALALEPDSAEAHVVLAMVNRDTRHFKLAEEEFRRSIDLNPNYATAHDWYGILLSDWGRTNEAVVHWHRAEALDPLSPIIKMHLLVWQSHIPPYERSLPECDRLIQTFPDFVMFHPWRAWILDRLGRYPEALSEILTARAGMSNSPFLLGFAGLIYSHSGDITNAHKVIAELDAALKNGYSVHYAIGLVHAALREYNQALDQFESAFADGEDVTGLIDDPNLDGLRALPRFRALLEKIAPKE